MYTLVLCTSKTKRNKKKPFQFEVEAECRVIIMLCAFLLKMWLHTWHTQFIKLNDFNNFLFLYFPRAAFSSNRKNRLCCVRARARICVSYIYIDTQQFLFIHFRFLWLLIIFGVFFLFLVFYYLMPFIWGTDANTICATVLFTWANHKSEADRILHNYLFIQDAQACACTENS